MIKGFELFNLERGYDFLQVYDGFISPNKLIAELTGNVTQFNQLYSNDRTVQIKFSR